MIQIMFNRWYGADKLVSTLNAAAVRFFFHLWVYRSLWGEYHHWESLWKLQDPEKASEVVRAAVCAWNASVDERRRSRKQEKD